MRWVSSVSQTDNLDLAVTKAAQEILAELDTQPDLLIAFFSSHFSDQIDRFPALIGRFFTRALLFGCSAGGAVGGGREIEHQPVLSLTAASLPDVSMRLFHLQQEQMAAQSLSRQALAGIPGQEDLVFIILADPLTCNPEPLLHSLDHAFPNSRTIGGMASGADGEQRQHLLIANQTIYRSGLIGLAFDGDIALDSIVAQGCKPIGEPYFVTSSRENRLLTLDGRPPVEVLQEIFQSLDKNDQALLNHSLFVGLGMHDGRSSYRQGDFLIRNIIGIDQENGAISIGAIPAPNSIVQFHLRDAQTSADDLRHLLSQYAATPAARQIQGGLLFSCLGRGVHLYGKSDHDSTVFRSLIGPVPLGGFFCNGEIGPVEGTTFVHAYTSAFGLFRRRE